ncbi:Efflux pump vrtL [Cladobotryum mycophilum]|uniref:Efflux pump vrtL n=1 Tax=Cladobotryum mycophilum TaxID=491253 RepID=A0ABR0T1D2_9HYPO
MAPTPEEHAPSEHTHVDDTFVLDHDKHADPTAAHPDLDDLSSESSSPPSSSSSSSHEHTRRDSSANQHLSRTVSEVRDGIRNERDLEIGPEEQDEKRNPVDENDPDLVKWDGPDDPQNPKNWSNKRKWAAVSCVSFFTLISPVASSMVAPGLPAISEYLHITKSIEQALVLSIFVAAYALGPLIWGPLSELYGRTIIIQVSNLWFLLFNLACGLAKNKGEMFAFRFLAGIGGSAPLPLVAGSLAISLQQKNEETYAPVLLHRKKTRLIKETGNTALHTEFDHPDRTLTQSLTIALTRPFRLLATQPIVQVMSLYMMYLYGLTYLVLSTFAELWGKEYHESPGIQGLNYISLGIGFFLGAQICAPLQDRIYAALKRRYVPDGGPGRPEFRVPMMIPGSILLPIGLLIYSWTAEKHTHWIAPNIGAAIFGAAIVIGFQCVQGYMVDSYTRYAASAVGALTVLRSLAGFGFPLFAPAMYDKLGYGKGGTVLAACAVAIGWPSPIFLWYYGPKLRAASKFTS